MDLPLSLRAPLKHCFLYLTVMCSMMDLVVAQGLTYKQLYSQIWSQPPGAQAAPSNTGAGFNSRSTYGSDPYSNGYGGGRTVNTPSFSPPGQSFSPPGPPQSLPVPPQRPVVPPSASFSDLRDFNSLIAGGLNVDKMPKSALAVQMGDVDYTRLRQLFLRDICQRLLSSDRAATFTFCIGIVALSPI